MGLLDRIFRRGNIVEDQKIIRQIMDQLDEGQSAQIIIGRLTRQGVAFKRARRLVRQVEEVRSHGLHLFDGKGG